MIISSVLNFCHIDNSGYALYFIFYNWDCCAILVNDRGIIHFLIKQSSLIVYNIVLVTLQIGVNGKSPKFLTLEDFSSEGNVTF